MNQTSEQIVRQVISSLTMPPIALTLTQEEADAIKDYVRQWYFEDNIQGAVHDGCKPDVQPPEEIKNLLWSGIPESTEYQDAVDLHNTEILAAFLRGKESKK